MRASESEKDPTPATAGVASGKLDLRIVKKAHKKSHPVEGWLFYFSSLILS